MAHGNGRGQGSGGRGARGRGSRTGGCGGGCGCGGCGGGWGGGDWGWAPPCGGWGGCGWGGGCGGYCGTPAVVPAPVPWPYPIMVPAAQPPAPAYAPPYPPVTGCVDAFGVNTGCAPMTGALGAQIAAAMPILQNVRNVSNGVQALMPALQTARDSMRRIRERVFPAQPSAAPAASPFAFTATSQPIAQPVAVCPDRSCVVYELRALDDMTGAAIQTAQVPDRTPIEVLGDVTGVIALEGNTPRRWSHVRLRATDGSTIEGWMKPESLVSGAPPISPGAPGASTGCACEKLSAEVDGTSIGKGILPGTRYDARNIGTSAVPLTAAQAQAYAWLYRRFGNPAFFRFGR